jgi:hypothetical protein
MVFRFLIWLAIVFFTSTRLLPFVGYLSSYCLYEAVLVVLLGFAAKITILFPGFASLLAGLLVRGACGAVWIYSCPCSLICLGVWGVFLGIFRGSLDLPRIFSTISQKDLGDLP